MEESFKDFNWDLNRFVEYRSPFTRKETYYQFKKTNLDFKGWNWNCICFKMRVLKHTTI